MNNTNHFFRRFADKKSATVDQAADHFVPTPIPRDVEPGHRDRSSFIPTEYSLLQPDYVANAFTETAQACAGLLNTTDVYSDPHVFHPHIDGKMPQYSAQYAAERALHENQAVRINAAKATRIKQLESEIACGESTVAEAQAEREKLKDARAKFSIGSVPLGPPATALAALADTMINFPFVSSIATQHWLLLFVTLLGLSIMSDGSMGLLGSILSRGEEHFGPKKYRLYIIALLSAFAFSVIFTLCMKAGSMAACFGTVNAKGEFVPKDHYTLAEWALCISTGLVPAVTGIISLILSDDPGAYLVQRRKAAEKVIARLQQELCFKRNELSALKASEDPFVYDKKCQIAAEYVLAWLPTALKLFMARLAAEKLSSADYTDIVTEYSTGLIREASLQSGLGFPAPNTQD